MTGSIRVTPDTCWTLSIPSPLPSSTEVQVGALGTMVAPCCVSGVSNGVMGPVEESILEGDDDAVRGDKEAGEGAGGIAL